MMDDAQLPQGLEDGIGGRLLTDACCFVFTNSHRDVGEEVTDEFLGGCHHLVADDSHLAPTVFQFMDEFRDAIVRAGGIERVLHISHVDIENLKRLCGWLERLRQKYNLNIKEKINN